MNSFGFFALRTVSRHHPLQPTAAATASFLLRSRAVRGFSSGADKDEKSAETVLPDSPEELKGIVQKLLKEVAEQQAKFKETHEKYLFALAEMENVRTRTRKDVENAKQFGIQKFSKDLLDVIDVLDMAIKSVPVEEASKEGSVHLKNLYEGIVMTEKEVLKVFERNGLVRFDPTGEKFDPNQHEALFEIPDPSKTHGTVGVVQKVGYSLNGRTLRPAQVGVIRSK